MSEQELYEIARRRIQQRNRRWMFWSLNLGGLILTLAGLILLGSTVTAAIFMAWVAVFVVHTIILGFVESSAGSIENEVAKLRKVIYEKPKRLELGEDGELVELDELEREDAQRIEIRSEVETRLRRRGLLLLDGGLWFAVVFFLWFSRGFGVSGLLVLLLLGWTGLVGLHFLYVLYVEMRERLVRSAIERERQFYLMRDDYEKRKHSEDRERDKASLRLSDDGELVDFMDAELEENAQRIRNS